MTTPRVTEIPADLEPVEPDPFIEALPPSADRLERELHVTAGRQARLTSYEHPHPAHRALR